MALVINTTAKIRFSEPQEAVTEPLGFLNSQYKTVVRHNFNNASSKSIFGIRRYVKNRRPFLISSAEVMLKVTIFFGALMAIFS